MGLTPEQKKDAQKKAAYARSQVWPAYRDLVDAWKEHVTGVKASERPSIARALAEAVEVYRAMRRPRVHPTGSVDWALEGLREALVDAAYYGQADDQTEVDE